MEGGHRWVERVACWTQRNSRLSFFKGSFTSWRGIYGGRRKLQ